MARGAYLAKRVEERHHKKLEALIPDLVNTIGQKSTAEALQVSTAFISQWLKKNGYIAKITWVKVDIAEVEKAS